jgi:hypothetical protein
MVQGLLEDGTLRKGQAHSLVNKINLATAMLNDGKATAAINRIGASFNEVEGLVNGGVLTQEDGQPLIDAANQVITALGG